MTRREAVLTVICELVADRPDATFQVFEVVEHMRFSPYSEVEIRNTIVTTMCATNHRPDRQRAPDLERVGRGRYRLIAAHERHS